MIRKIEIKKISPILVCEFLIYLLADPLLIRQFTYFYQIPSIPSHEKGGTTSTTFCYIKLFFYLFLSKSSPKKRRYNIFCNFLSQTSNFFFNYLNQIPSISSHEKGGTTSVTFCTNIQLFIYLLLSNFINTLTWKRRYNVCNILYKHPTFFFTCFHQYPHMKKEV